MRFSFVTANFVARELKYKMTDGWSQGDTATNNAFRQVDTFVERFEELLEEIAELGFDTVDIWNSHLNWTWATQKHLSSAKILLEKQGLQVYSLAGGFGSNAEEVAKACHVAKSVGAKVLAGFAPAHDPDVRKVLQENHIKFGYENHGEKTPEEILEKIGDGAGGYVGATIDTGWWATQRYDPAEAIRKIGKHIVAVHLKDITEIGGSETCQLGKGVVPIAACIAALEEVGYEGSIAIEHEPKRRNPSKEIAGSLEYLQGL